MKEMSLSDKDAAATSLAEISSRSSLNVLFIVYNIYRLLFSKKLQQTSNK